MKRKRRSIADNEEQNWKEPETRCRAREALTGPEEEGATEGSTTAFPSLVLTQPHVSTRHCLADP
eukprot:3938627-Rhodomonas_salina.3